MKKKQKNPDKLIKYLTALVVICAIIVITITVIINQGKTYNNTAPQNTLSRNVATKGILAKSKRFVVFATNNNDVAVDLDIVVNFYDKNGTLIGTDSDNLRAVGANNNVAIELYQVPDGWDTFKILSKAEEATETPYIDDLNLNYLDNGENIEVHVTNNSSNTIEYLTVAVVYYQDDEVVGFDFGIEPDVASNSTANFELYYPYDIDENNLEFNNYKVFINEAFSYNYE